MKALRRERAARAAPSGSFKSPCHCAIDTAVEPVVVCPELSTTVTVTVKVPTDWYSVGVGKPRMRLRGSPSCRRRS